MTRDEFIQQTVIATLPTYFTRTKRVAMDYAPYPQTVQLTVSEAQDECIQDANRLADKLGLKETT